MRILDWAILCSLKKMPTAKLRSMSLDGGDRGGFLEYMEMVTDGAITAKIQN